MKIDKMFIITAIVCLCLSPRARSQDLSNLTLIAHYPLTSTANDTTGNYGPMILRNTPFQDGGIYCDGIYSSCGAITPNITGLKYEAFAVSARFKVSGYHSAGLIPVFICGDTWRWMGIGLLPDSVMGYIYNYSSSQYTNVKFSLNTWHEATLTYDSASGTGKYYLDGVLMGSRQFQLDHGNERDVTISHTGRGYVFKGIFGDLKIYTKTDQTHVGSGGDGTPEQFRLVRVHPNPFHRTTTITYALAHADFVTLKIHDAVGREIRTLVERYQEADSYSVGFDAGGLPDGVYYYLLMMGGKRAEAGKMVMMR